MATANQALDPETYLTVEMFSSMRSIPNKDLSVSFEFDTASTPISLEDDRKLTDTH